MNLERWQRIEELYHLALEREGAERAAYLEAACAEDAELLREAKTLLAAHEQAGDFIEEPVASVAACLLTGERSSARIGQQIGPYQILALLGMGGMGEVYLASRADDQYQKQVAIKIVKRDMDSEIILRRFRRERQILASLNHPHIAGLLDGGLTADGLPYFVVEYVQGKPLDEYCDAGKLTTTARLELFRDVCSAVHYAHQNLVIHRDIKPSNILVTNEGVVKLLDFGIAKLLNPEIFSERSELTATAMWLMTPEYASPEQVTNAAITTSSDVYSLGVLLYELLSGYRPYRLKSRTPHEIVRVICDEEPDKPSTVINRPGVLTVEGERETIKTPKFVSETREGELEKLRRRLAGDLDCIVLKALRKEPERRYASVEQFSEDIRRHLEGLPVMARKGTSFYRAGKFIRRHRVGVMAATLVILALLIDMVATAWQARVARAERARAEQRFNDVRRLANSFMFEFHDAIKDLPGATPARELLVQRAVEYLDSLAREAKGDSSLQLELATAYQKIGDVQGNNNYANLGDTIGAVESYRKALAMHEALVLAEPTSATARRALSVSHIKVGDMLMQTGSVAAALESYRQALRAAAELAAVDATDVLTRHNLALSHHKVGNALTMIGDTSEALQSHYRALALREKLSIDDPANLRARRDVSVSLERISRVLRITGDLAGALEKARQAQAISEELSAADPTNGEARRDVGVGYQSIGLILMKMGNPGEALVNFRRGLAIDEELLAVDPKNVEAHRDLASSYATIGEAMSQITNAAGALKNFRKALEILNTLMKTNTQSTDLRNDAAEVYSKIGALMITTGNTTGALESYQKAAAIYEGIVAADQANVEARSAIADVYSNLNRANQMLASGRRTPVNARSEK